MTAVKKRRVMIVDDEPLTAEILRCALEDRGYDVTVRHEALGTSAAVIRDQPDVVVIDIEMPAIKGNDVARLLANNKALTRTSFILHSSRAAAELEVAARECGAIGAITKSTGLAAFLSEFERLMRGRFVP